MGRKIGISIQDFFEIIPTLIVTYEDLKYILEDDDIRKQFYRLYDMHTKGEYDISLLEDFLIDNKEYLNKENLVLTLAKNCMYQLKTFDDELKKAQFIQDGKRRLVTITEINKRKKICEDTLKEIRRVGKGLDIILSFYREDDDKKQFELDVIDSREIIDKKHISKSKDLKRFDKIENSFADDEENIGIGYILQILNLSDLKEAFPIDLGEDGEKNISYNESRKFGINIENLIFDRKILREGVIKYEDLLKISDGEYRLMREQMRYDDFIPYMKEAIKEYIAYVNLDKLLLMAAYKYNDVLERLNDKNETKGYEQILKVILENIENKNAEYSFDLEYELDGQIIIKDSKYSVKELKKIANRFVDDEYISEKEIQENRSKIESGEKSLIDFDNRYIDVIFPNKDLEAVAYLSIENLEFVSAKLGWDEKEKINKIILLYNHGDISIEQIKEFNKVINLSNKINSYELIQYYKNSIEKDSIEEKDKFNRFSELYKELLLKEQPEEVIEEKQDELVNSILDNYQGEDYIKVASEFYIKGLIPLEILVEWNGEKIVDIFYKNALISLEDIEKLVNFNKLSFEYISGIYMKMANKNDIEYDERLKYISTGYIPEKEIFSLYENGLIFETDLRNLAQKGIVRVSETEKIINNRSKEDLEKNSSIKLKGLNGLKKINNDIYSKDDQEHERNEKGEEKPKYIIDPNKREEFINMFNAYRAETDLEEDSPFYDYEFYVIPDESGGIGLNSAIIAERYYEDKITEEKFALNNATYFFRYKDLMVLSNLKKSEMTKERENVVFTAKHILADENKNGYWAAGVIYGIAKTMLSSDLKEYTKTKQRRIIIEKLNQMYSEEQILEILDMASKIDSGEYTYKIVNPEEKILRKSGKTREKQNNIIDKDNQR